MKQAIILLVTLMSAFISRAEHLKFESAETQTALLELYTSEGCSSCPPAEAWLSRLKNSPDLWTNFVPLAFHIDYWNNLGWRDPWSDKAFSARQQAYARSWKNDSIYTPEFVLNGKEWRNPSSAVVPASHRKAGVLTLMSNSDDEWVVTFNPADSKSIPLEAHVAFLGCGLASDVRAGENSGRRLAHDFVVMTNLSTPLDRKGSVATGKVRLPAPAAGNGAIAIAVWVCEAGRLEPIQATGGWVASKTR